MKMVVLHRCRTGKSEKTLKRLNIVPLIATQPDFTTLRFVGNEKTQVSFSTFRNFQTLLEGRN